MTLLQHSRLSSFEPAQHHSMPPSQRSAAPLRAASCRYTGESGTSYRRRIWDSYTVSGEGSHSDWLSGHYSGDNRWYRTGNWIFYGTFFSGDDWLMVTDTWQRARWDRSRDSSFASAITHNYKLGVSINHGASGETTAWSVMFAAFYDRILTDEEMLQTEEWMDNSFCITPLSTCYADTLAPPPSPPPPPPNVEGVGCVSDNTTDFFCNATTGM